MSYRVTAIQKIYKCTQVLKTEFLILKYCSNSLFCFDHFPLFHMNVLLLTLPSVYVHVLYVQHIVLFYTKYNSLHFVIRTLYIREYACMIS